MAAAFQVMGIKVPPDQGVPYFGVLAAGSVIDNIGSITRGGSSVQLDASGEINVQGASGQLVQVHATGSTGEARLRYSDSNVEVGVTASLDTQYKAKLYSDIDVAGATALVVVKAANANATGLAGVSLQSENYISIDYNQDGGLAGTDVFSISRNATPVISADENGAVALTPVIGQDLNLTAAGAGTINVGAAGAIGIQATGADVTISTTTSGDIHIESVGTIYAQIGDREDFLFTDHNGATVASVAENGAATFDSVSTDTVSNSGGSLLLEGGNGNVQAKLGDNAGTYKFSVLDSAAGEVAYIDSSGNASFNTIVGFGLDEAYDKAGSGAGRTITADSGTVQIIVPDASNNAGLTITQNEVTNAVNAADFSSGYVNTSLATPYDGATLKLTQSGAAGSGNVAPALHLDYAGAGFSVMLTGSGPNLGMGSFDLSQYHGAVALSALGTGTTIQAQLAAIAQGVSGSEFNGRIRTLVQARRDNGAIEPVGDCELDVLSYIAHASNTGDATSNFKATNEGTGHAEAYLIAEIDNTSNNDIALVRIQSTTNSAGSGTAWIDIDADDNIDIHAGTQIDIDAQTAIQMTSRVPSYWTVIGAQLTLSTSTSGDIQLAPAGDIAILADNIRTDTTTGMQIATGTTQKLGLWGATPIVRPSAYTQTYATADKTHAARTSAALTDSIGGSVSTTLAAIPDPADSPVSADALRDDLVANVLPKIRDALSSLADQVNKGRADALDSAQVVNALIDDLQAFGAVG